MEDHSAIPVLEDEAIQFDFLLVEPQDDHVSVDAFLCIHRNNSEKCLQMDDIPCKFGGINIGTDRVQQYLKAREVPDVKPSEIEAGEYQVPNVLSSSCEDYLLDGEFEESGTKLDHESGIGLQKLVSGNHNQSRRIGDHGTSQKLDSSGTTNQVDNCQGDLNVNESESHGIFSRTGDSEKSIGNSWFKYPAFAVINMEEDVSSIFSEGNNELMSFNPGLTSGQMTCPFTSKQETSLVLMCEMENKDSIIQKDASLMKRPIQARSIDNHDEKRLRKPPKRFIDELSEPKSKPYLKKREVSTPSSKGKLSSVRASKHRNKKPKSERSFPEGSAGKAIQVHETSQKSDSFGTTNQVDNCQGDLNVNESESHGIFSCTGDSEKSIGNSWFKYPAFTVINMEEDVSSMFSEGNNELMSLNPGLTSGQRTCPFTSKQETSPVLMCQMENKDSIIQKDASLVKRPIQACSIDSHDEKRLRKPPKRFIDELSEPKSKPYLKKREVSTPSSKGKMSSVRASKHRNMKPKSERSFPDDSAGKAIQVPFGPLVQKDSGTKQDPGVAKAKMESHQFLASSLNIKVLQYDKEVSMSESEEDNVVVLKLEEDGGGRRKHHILWTVSEVRRLIEGVSQYGVGRWSRIKKDLFSSSAHRTPVDLKDKWRNLLKASRAQRDSKRGEDGKRNLAWRPLPKSILGRVNELATIYPYPRDMRSKR